MAKNSGVVDKKDEGQSNGGAHPSRWWQWLLVYPGLAVALLGSFPTYVEAVKSSRLGVPFGRSNDAEEQNLLWQKNFECPQKHQLASLKNKQDVEIASTVCDSGDVLLSGKRPDWDIPRYRWVPENDLAPTTAAQDRKASALEFISSAQAAETPRTQLAQWGGVQIICQRWVGNGLLLQRLSSPQGCFDQVINTYNGMVINRYPALCSPQC